MSKTLTPASPCTATLTPDTGGGLLVELHVPTYSGGVTLSLQAERSSDGDWRVYIPWPDGMEEEDVRSVNGGVGDCRDGILYLGAPDVPVKARFRRGGSDG